MISKIAVLARDRPIYFFLGGFSILLFLIFLASIVLASILLYSPWEFSGIWKILLVMVVFMPISPIFFMLGLLFLEWYFNLFRLGWVIGLDKKPFLQWFLRWAEIE